jgi:hypothetical protein
MATPGLAMPLLACEGVFQAGRACGWRCVDDDLLGHRNDIDLRSIRLFGTRGHRRQLPSPRLRGLLKQLGRIHEVATTVRFRYLREVLNLRPEFSLWSAPSEHRVKISGSARSERHKAVPYNNLLPFDGRLADAHPSAASTMILPA